MHLEDVGVIERTSCDMLARCSLARDVFGRVFRDLAEGFAITVTVREYMFLRSKTQRGTIRQ